MDRQKPPAANRPSQNAGATHTTDERLVELALTGDAASLDTLLRRHQAWLYNVALRMFQQPQDAEVLVAYLLRIGVQVLLASRLTAAKEYISYGKE